MNSKKQKKKMIVETVVGILLFHLFFTFLDTRQITIVSKQKAEADMIVEFENKGYTEVCIENATFQLIGYLVITDRYVPYLSNDFTVRSFETGEELLQVWSANQIPSIEEYRRTIIPKESYAQLGDDVLIKKGTPSYMIDGTGRKNWTVTYYAFFESETVEEQDLIEWVKQQSDYTMGRKVTLLVYNGVTDISFYEQISTGIIQRLNGCPLSGAYQCFYDSIKNIQVIPEGYGF